MKVRNAIVTDVRYRMALAPLRCLAKTKWWVTGTEFESVPKREVLGFYSNCIDVKRRIPDSDPVGGLYELCKNMDSPPAVIPVGRKMMDALVDHPELKEVCCFHLPTREAITLADDKKIVTQRARALGIPTPMTWEDMSRVTYPAVVKYRNGELLGIRAENRYKIVHNSEELEATLAEVKRLDSDPVVQEYIPGHDCGIAVLMQHGYLVDYIAYESLMEYPLKGGPTCLLRTVQSAKMRDYAKGLLNDIGYDNGLAMLDFRGPVEEPRFLEINPRVWGSANICDVADSGLFDSWARCAMGEVVQPTGYALGKRMKFSPQYQAALVSRAKGGESVLKCAGELFGARRVAEGLRYCDGGPYRRYIKNLIRSKF